jgi:DNA primase
MITEISEEEKQLGIAKLINLCHANIFVGNNPVLKYLNKRGISDATINKFKIGAFPTDTELVARFMGRTPAFKTGIISSTNNTLHSRFSTHQLIIPIYNEFQHPIAIIGRCLLPEAKRTELNLAKYINTSFKKGNCLFGMNFAKDAIRKQNQVYVVEGNFDVITAYQNGMKNVVATSGTMLTRQQIIILSRYTDSIKIMFDNDEAGQTSSQKALKKYSNLGLNVEIAHLPQDVKDLDEYFIKHKTSSL